ETTHVLKASRVHSTLSLSQWNQLSTNTTSIQLLLSDSCVSTVLTKTSRSTWKLTMLLCLVTLSNTNFKLLLMLVCLVQSTLTAVTIKTDGILTNSRSISTKPLKLCWLSSKLVVSKLVVLTSTLRLVVTQLTLKIYFSLTSLVWMCSPLLLLSLTKFLTNQNIRNGELNVTLLSTAVRVQNSKLVSFHLLTFVTMLLLMANLS